MSEVEEPAPIILSLLSDWIPIWPKKRKVITGSKIDINVAIYFLILIFATAIHNALLMSSKPADDNMIISMEGPVHNFSYISLVLQFVLCHGQYIIVRELSRDHEGLSHIAQFLITRPLQVIMKDVDAS